ncbi:hypothetical protein ALQ16_204662 [Pseudomonas syringae pv. actinidiae]|nr:hypothetical protein ALQ16_204662 [Pseudomonas syringae pv. actinidiae]
MAQYAVTNAFVRHRAQLFLDAAQAHTRRNVRGKADREQAAEPAHRAAEVSVVKQVFAAVPFQLHQHRRLLAPLAQHLRQRGQQQVVDLRAVGGRRDFQQFVSQVLAQPRRRMGCVASAHRAFGLVAGQRLIVALQSAQPVITLGRQRFAGRILLQLLGPMLERRGFRCQRHRVAFRQGDVSLLQVFQQHPPGHAVHRQMMNHQQETLLAMRQVDQQRPQQRTVFQVQAALCFGSQFGQTFGTVQFVNPEQIPSVQCTKRGSPLAVLLSETEAQRVMLFDQCRERSLKVDCIQRLKGLEHQRLIPVLTFRNVQFEETCLYRQQRQRTADLLHHSGRFFLDQFGDRGQLADGLLFKQLLGAEFDALALGAGDDLQAEDRIAAQFEEVVGAADLIQFQHVGPHGGELFLDLANWRGIALFDHARFWQRALVELAIGGQRQLVQQQDLRGHHVVGQARRQLLAQAVNSQAGTGCSDAIGHQLQTRFVFIDRQRQHTDLRDRRQTQQHPRHFSGLDTIAAHLDLIVGAADEFQQALMISPHAVATAVNAAAILGERVWHEALGSQCRLADVAPRHAVAANVQLACDLRGDGVQHVIQHVSAGPRQWLTDRHLGGFLWERACSRRR